MDIKEAITKALKENKKVKRTSNWCEGVYIKPSSLKRPIGLESDHGLPPAKCWNPSIEDLLAEDYELTD